MFNYSDTVIWLLLIKYWNRSGPGGTLKDTGFNSSLNMSWSGAGRRQWLTSKQVNTDKQPPHKLFNDIFCLKEVQFLFDSPHGKSVSHVRIGNLFLDLPLLKMSSLSRAWNQRACLLSKSDYTRSTFWLQSATGRCLLICGLNTETGKSQGSYQGYLGALKVHCPISWPFCNQVSYKCTLVELVHPCMLIWKHVGLDWRLIFVC